MLNPAIYRLALAPVLLALLVVAFSLEDRPQPLRSNLAPDAYDATRAQRTLSDLARRYPERRPGGNGDAALARDIEGRLRAAISPAGARIDVSRLVSAPTDEGQTIDGLQDLTTVIATRPGSPGPGIVVVAHRDSAELDARADLGGTAALLELARVAGDGRLQRTITFVSTSGGSGGLAGARAAARRISSTLPGGVEAVLVLGNVAGARVSKPYVVGWSNGERGAPLQLRRTVEVAVREQIGQDAGGARAPEQWLRLAFPYATGEQGAFLRRGIPAVLLSATGEAAPSRSDAAAPEVERSRLQAFGQATLRAMYALDDAGEVRERPDRAVVTNRKVLPEWAVRLLVGALLLPALLATIDGFARARRRRAKVGQGVRWVLAGAFSAAVAFAFAVLLRVTGLLPAAPPAPVPEGSIPVEPAAAVAMGLVVVACAFGLRRLALRAGRLHEDPADHTGAAAAVLLLFAAVAVAVWLDNPYQAVFFVPAAHAWLFALNPDSPLPRPARVVVALLGVVPFVLVVLAGLDGLDLSPGAALWQGLLLVAGGHIGPVSWVVWSLALACAGGAVAVAARHREGEDPAQDVTVRGPRTYAGPGSLGGTESALRR